MTIDLAGALRRYRPERRTAQVTLRPKEVLFSAAAAASGPGRLRLVLDANIYISDAAGRLPATAVALLDRGLLHHCTVCLAELAVGVANLSPQDAKARAIREHYSGLMASVAGTRVLDPDDEIWVEAGVVTGTLARTQSLPASRRKELLNDALIYLTAAKQGLPVLTGDREDFDRLQQIIGRGEFIYVDPD